MNRFAPPCRLLVATVAAWALAWPAAGETMAEAVARAVAEHPQVLAQLSGQDVARENTLAAVGALHPQVTTQLSRGLDYNDTAGMRDSGDGDGAGLYRGINSISASQLLYDYDQTRNRVRRSEQTQESAARILDETRDRIAIDGCGAYLSMLNAHAQVRLAGDNVRAHEEYLRKVELRRDKGLGRSTDVLPVQSRLALARATLRQQEGARESALARYVEVLLRPPADLGDLADPPTPALPADVGEAVARATRQSPGLARQFNDINLARTDVEIARGALWPRLSAQAQASWNTNVGGTEGENRQQTLELVLVHDLFSGGSKMAALRAARARLQLQQYSYDDATRQLERGVRQAWTNLEAERDALAQLRQHQELAAETITAYEAQFELGQRGLLDLLDAQTELFNARSRVVLSEYRLLQAHYSLLQAIGDLLPTLRQLAPESAGEAADAQPGAATPAAEAAPAAPAGDAQPAP